MVRYQFVRIPVALISALPLQRCDKSSPLQLLKRQFSKTLDSIWSWLRGATSSRTMRSQVEAANWSSKVKLVVRGARRGQVVGHGHLEGKLCGAQQRRKCISPTRRFANPMFWGWDLLQNVMVLIKPGECRPARNAQPWRILII